MCLSQAIQLVGFLYLGMVRFNHFSFPADFAASSRTLGRAPSHLGAGSALHSFALASFGSMDCAGEPGTGKGILSEASFPEAVDRPGPIGTPVNCRGAPKKHKSISRLKKKRKKKKNKKRAFGVACSAAQAGNWPKGIASDLL